MTEHHHSPLSDARFDALLDQALAPPEVPPGLAQRILAATRDELTAKATTRPVVGRIRPRVQGFLVAAAALAACITVIVALWPVPRSTTVTTPSPVLATIDIDQELAAEPFDTDVDSELQLLRLDIEIAQINAGEISAQPLRESMTEWEWELDTFDAIF